MTDMGLFEPDHQSAEFRLAEPLRHLAAQYSSLRLGSRLAFPGDDQHERQPFTVSTPQEGRKRVVRAGLGHAVQVEPGVDLLFST